jgi:hypothetical protein
VRGAFRMLLLIPFMIIKPMTSHKIRLKLENISASSIFLYNSSTCNILNSSFIICIFTARRIPVCNALILLMFLLFCGQKNSPFVIIISAMLLRAYGNLLPNYRLKLTAPSFTPLAVYNFAAGKRLCPRPAA